MFYPLPGHLPVPILDPLHDPPPDLLADCLLRSLPRRPSDQSPG